MIAQGSKERENNRSRKVTSSRRWRCWVGGFVIDRKEARWKLEALCWLLTAAAQITTTVFELINRGDHRDTIGLVDLAHSAGNKTDEGGGTIEQLIECSQLDFVDNELHTGVEFVAVSEQHDRLGLLSLSSEFF